MREVIEEMLHVADGIVGERRVFAVAASDGLVAAASVLLLLPRERKGTAFVQMSLSLSQPKTNSPSTLYFHEAKNALSRRCITCSVSVVGIVTVDVFVGCAPRNYT